MFSSPRPQNDTAAPLAAPSNGDKKCKTTATTSESERPVTASSAYKSGPTDVDTVRGEESAPAPTVFESNRKPIEGVSVVGGAVQHHELSKTADTEHSRQLSNQERGRDEEPAMPWPMIVPGLQSAAPEQQLASTVGMMGAAGRMTTEGFGSLSKKSKPSMPESSPPQVNRIVQNSLYLHRVDIIRSSLWIVSNWYWQVSVTIGVLPGERDEEPGEPCSGRVVM